MNPGGPGESCVDFLRGIGPTASSPGCRSTHSPSAAVGSGRRSCSFGVSDPVSGADGVRLMAALAAARAGNGAPLLRLADGYLGRKADGAYSRSSQPTRPSAAWTDSRWAPNNAVRATPPVRVGGSPPGPLRPSRRSAAATGPRGFGRRALASPLPGSPTIVVVGSPATRRPGDAGRQRGIGRPGTRGGPAAHQRRRHPTAETGFGGPCDRWTLTYLVTASPPASGTVCR
jgi:hypothetical protein